jgi:hypothetical protein
LQRRAGRGQADRSWITSNREALRVKGAQLYLAVTDRHQRTR